MQRLFLFSGAFLLAGIIWLAVGTSQAIVSTGAAPVLAHDASASSKPLLTPTPVPTCAPSWAVVETQNVLPGETQFQELSSVDAVSSSDVWAVGTYTVRGYSHRKNAPRTMPGAPPAREGSVPSIYDVNRSLIEHWDGSAWAIVPAPTSGNDSNVLSEVSVISSTDIWAVGYFISDLGVGQTLTLHWDGSTWSLVPSANTTILQDNALNSVEAVAPDNVWAAGYASDENGRLMTLIEHWNGTAWSIVASPNAGTHDNVLVDLSAISAGDIWAVGDYANYDNFNGSTRTLSMHWDGSAWSVVPSPAVGTGYNGFLAVDGVAPNDVWAVGEFYSTAGGTRVLLEHWDGSNWNVVPLSNPEQNSARLMAIDALSTNDVWIAGYGVSPTYTTQGMTLHWDGSAWSVVRAASTSEYAQSYFLGVTAITADDVWVVGEAYTMTAPHPLTLSEHYSTACVSCELRFTDVPEGSTFYDAVECLVCQGIVSGYTLYPSPPPPVPTGVNPTPGTPWPTIDPNLTPSPYPTPEMVFRPGANVTRGQLAKIVSNSAGYMNDPGQQMFADVYPYSTFYDYVNRLARRNILSGYPCGGPGEPCGSANLPYFRPGNNASRGQIAKIISNTAGFAEPHTDQTFADVTVDNTFYIFIARLYSRNIVVGYPCGAAGEPCGPGSLPYFRPGAAASRGQTVKMDGKALLPNCYIP